MKIGIIVAMQKELQLLLPLIEEREEQEIDGYKFHKGSIGTHQVIVMQCGIGKVNSAIGTVRLIDNYSPDTIINTGVAGGADSSMRVLDVLVATEVAYHDVWCGPGTVYGAAAGCEPILKPNGTIIDTARRILKLPNVRYGLICSGDKFISKVEEVAEIKHNFKDVLAVDMESASIGQVSVMRGIPFNVIRVISDTPGEEENISQYENFWVDAPMETFKVLVELLNNM